MQDVTDYGQTLYQIALGQYVDDCQGEGVALSLDTTLFREMMLALEKVDMDKLNSTISNSDRQDEIGANTLLVDDFDWLSVHNGVRGRSNAEPLIIPMQDGGSKHIPVHIEVLFINPFTANMDLSLKYLENAIACMNPDQHIMMFPDDNEPVAAQNAKQMVADWQTELEEQQELLKKANAEKKKEIEANIQSLEELLANKVFYWTISSDMIARYRELVPLCFAATPNLLNFTALDGKSEISSLMDRYRQGKMSLDQLIAEADNKIQMILLERQ
jgi:hypothetical protein